MERSTVWVLVCDASRARLFEVKRGDELGMIEELDHPSSRARARDLMADAQGRKPNGQPGHRNNHRPGAEPDTDPKEVEAIKFAQTLAAKLDKARVERSFDRLVLAAPPHFLGLLKGELDEQVQKLLALTVSKDLTGIEVRELQERLPLAQIAANSA
jgi:protein required for attachment to host cells